MEINKSLSFKNNLYIGFMIFSLFFGAGNLIFPPEIGVGAGSNVWLAIGGFLISGVGLPLLGILAVAYTSKTGSAEDLSNKVHPIFAVAITSITYLTVGPFFAAPRTGVVSYEIAIVPFLQESNAATLAIFTTVYFLIVYLLALFPNKFVELFGKLITPFLLIVLFILIAAVIISPFNSAGVPSEEWAQYSLFKGITEGYLTMDAIVSIVFAIIIINSIKEKGIYEKKEIQKIIWKSGIVAVICLSIVYIGLAYLGTMSSSLTFTSGAAILSGVSQAYFGVYGNIILGAAILLACIPTATGLMSSCALYFNKLVPAVSYKAFVTIFVLFSAIVSNVGLEQLIEFSIPALTFIYPIIIVLILMSFFKRLFQDHRYVYRGAVILTTIVSLNDGLVAVNKNWDFIAPFIQLPFANVGFGWIVPALIGAIAGWLLSLLTKQPTVHK